MRFCLPDAELGMNLFFIFRSPVPLGGGLREEFVFLVWMFEIVLNSHLRGVLFRSSVSVKFPTGRATVLLNKSPPQGCEALSVFQFKHVFATLTIIGVRRTQP